MPKEERYDFVIVGGGPNGVALAAYLGKCGASVCVLEERPEAGGACENTEPIPGVRITPHAMYMYAGPAPGFEQLELHKYGFRMDWSPQSKNLAEQQTRGVATTQGLAPITDKDAMGWAKLSGMLGQPMFIKELLRSIFWCPPHPPEVEVTAENVPYMQVYKKHQPDVWTEELLDMTMFDLMDEYLETEPVKVMHAMVAWYSGAAGHWEGVAIPALGCDITLTIYSGISVPRGGMHGYFHSIIRCAIAHGAVIRTCCPVDEIIIQDGRAVGVRLRGTATTDEKKIWANKAVISDVDVKQTFTKLVGSQHVSTSFRRKVEDISLKGGSIWVSHLLTREKLRCRPKFRNPVSGDDAGLGPYPCDSREIYYEHVADVDGHRGRPTMPPERLMWLSTPGDRFDAADPQCTIPGLHLASPYYTYVPPPEYTVGGPDALDREKEEINAYLRKAFRQTLENLTDENLVHHWANTPYESEFRNTGLIGGTWCGTRHCDDQWGENRPLPELARYRTPIERLYLCNQTACHPGGLALMAIPYNLMHILIEDGLAEPGKWWYPSPWYIPQRGKISAASYQGGK
ncbi:MAG: NAD(P)/FAD-dependent oxidoreductase [Chloroflexi bacterium]|nr:NAD(P)/FAD-dependent oxidoreductase [Chloroflexota bacterium]